LLFCCGGFYNEEKLDLVLFVIFNTLIATVTRLAGVCGWYGVGGGTEEGRGM